MGKLDGKVALVTGGSRGIGRAICFKLAEEGASVGVNYNTNETAALEVVQQIKTYGGNAVALVGDVSAPGTAKVLVDATVAALGGMNILVNNARVARDTKFVALSDEDWEISWRTNVMGPVWLCRAALRGPMKRGGVIINNASKVGLSPHDSQGAYGATKAALINLTGTLAQEYGERGVRVVAVAAGFIDTDMTRAVKGVNLMEVAKERQDLKITGQPEDVATTVAFLASDDARFITGTCFEVSGGLR